MYEKESALRIIDVLIRHAKGKLTSRYTLGLERAYESIEQGSPKKALEEQRAWCDNMKRKKKKV